MNILKNARCLGCAMLAIAVLEIPSEAQNPPHVYSGPGWAEDLNIDGLKAPRILQVVIGEFADSVGGADMASLGSDGKVYVSPGFGQVRFTESTNAPVGIKSLAKLEGETQDQLVGTDGTRVYRYSWSGQGHTWTAIDTAAAPMGGEQLVSVESGASAGTSILISIDAAGSQLQISKLIAGSLTSGGVLTSTQLGQGTIHAAVGGNFTSDPNRTIQLAIVTDNGLIFRELDGSVLTYGGYTQPDRAGFPVNVFLSVLPGSKMAVGRDTVAWHYDFPGIGSILNLIYDDHHELQYVMGLGLQEVGFADFVGGSSHDLFYGASNGEIIIAKNTEKTAVGEALFTLDLTQTAVISLNKAPMNGSAIPTGTQIFIRSLDTDNDGHEEVFIIDPRKWLCRIPKPTISSPEEVKFKGLGTVWANGSDIYFDLDIEMPATQTVTEVDWWIYEWPDVGSHKPGNQWPSTIPYVFEDPFDSGTWTGGTGTMTFAVPAGHYFPTDYFMISLQPRNGTQELAPSAWVWGGSEEYAPQSGDDPRTPWFTEVSETESGSYFIKSLTPGNTGGKPGPREGPFDRPPTRGGG